MKKHLIIAGIICTGIIQTTNAAYKCIGLNNQSRDACTSASSTGESWSATCSGIPIRGIAMCDHHTDNPEMGSTTENLTLINTSAPTPICWCKMISPAISQWVSPITTVSSGSNCPYFCAQNCIKTLENRSAELFRIRLFSNLSD